MPQRTGVGAQIGFGEETTYGTAVTPTRFLRFLSEGIRGQVEHHVSRGMVRTARKDVVRTIPGGGQGPVALEVPVRGIGLLLKHALGGFSSAWPGGTKATVTLTIDVIPVDGDTMTLAAKVYTYKTALTSPAVDGEILIGANVAASQANTVAAITLAAGAGVQYAAAMTSHPSVTIGAFAAGAATVTALVEGTAGNAIVSTETFTPASDIFSAATLSGGLAGTDTRYTHTYQPSAQGLRERALTVEVGVPSVSGVLEKKLCAGGKIPSWELAASVGEALRFTPTFDFREVTTPATAPATPTYPADDSPFIWVDGALTIGGVAQSVRSFTVQGENGLALDRRFLGQTLKSEPLDELLNVTGSFDVEWEDRDLANAFRAGTAATLVLTFTHADLIPSSATKYALTVTVQNVHYDGDVDPTVDGPEVIGQSVPWFAVDDDTNPLIKIAHDTDDTAP